MPNEWIVEDFPSDAAARVILVAFIAAVCNAQPKLKERLKFVLGAQSAKAASPTKRRTIDAARAWVEKLSTRGTP